MPDKDQSNTNTKSIEQYSLWKILLIWALATVPMGLLAWVIYPTLVPRIKMESSIFLWILMIIGLMWQVALSFIILYREHGTLRPSAIRYRTWRQQPRDPKTVQPRAILWLWLIPSLVLAVVLALFVAPAIKRIWTSIIPFFAEPSGYSLQKLAEQPEKWVGAWYLVGLMLVHIVGNYLIWRGVFVPQYITA